jgi:hypothetical protein
MRRVARPVVHMPISGGIEIPGQEKKIIYAVSTAMYGKCDFAAGLTIEGNIVWLKHPMSCLLRTPRWRIRFRDCAPVQPTACP